MIASVAVSRDGRLAVSDGHDHVLRVWDVPTGKEVRRFDGPSGTVWGVALSPDARLAATAGDDGTVRLWRLRK
jgi:WD40 repeat protein